MTPDPKYRQRVRLIRTCCWIAALFLFVAALLTAGTDGNVAGVFGVMALVALRYAVECRREIDGWTRRRYPFREPEMIYETDTGRYYERVPGGGWQQVWL